MIPLGIFRNSKKRVFRLFAIAVIVIGFMSHGYSQKFASLVGARLGVKTVAFSAKIALSEHNFLEGTMGIFTPQPDFTIGAGVAYHRHIALSGNKNFQFYYGASVKAVIGDESGGGLGVDAGLIYLYKKINIGVDVLPTYFFNDVLEFRPLFGIHLRVVNY